MGDRFSLPEDDSTYPALRFQRLFQMDHKDIGRCWRMPSQMSMAQVEQALWDNKVLEHWADCDLETKNNSVLADIHPDIMARFALAENIADAFILLNPELRQVTFDRTVWGELRGFLHGVVSGFNTDDIQAWIDKTINYDLIRELEAYLQEEFRAPESDSVYPLQLRRQFNARVNAGDPCVHHDIHSILWAPCEKTIYKIYDALEARRAFKASGFQPD